MNSPLSLVRSAGVIYTVPVIGEHLYIHVPFCDGKCTYCGFYSVTYDNALADRYMAAIGMELSAFTADGRLSPETIYLGGGTPSILPASQLSRLFRIIHKHISTKQLTEWTVEANPGTLSPEKLRILQEAGVNRISVGAQSFDNSVLVTIGRRHKASAISETLQAIRESGIDNVGLDLIAALPGVDDSSWKATVDAAMSLDPRHISVYSLSLEKGSKMSRQFEAGSLTIPGEDEQLRALETAENLLSAGKYARYEISNYARPGFEARHNLACWRGLDYVGFGPAASSRVGLKRWTNAPDLDGYIKALESGSTPPREEETLTEACDAAERFVFAFRLAEGVDVLEYSKIAGSRPYEWQATLERLMTDGLTDERNGRWFLTERGRQMADFVAGELLST